ncbi:MAG: hypothetical protein ACRD7E_16865 [Bryobacteraceae bacterium]
METSRPIVYSILLGLLLAVTVHGQPASGNIHGIVKDSTGAVVSDVRLGLLMAN